MTAIFMHKLSLNLKDIEYDESFIAYQSKNLPVFAFQHVGR